jgi:hypothetical protein
MIKRVLLSLVFVMGFSTAHAGLLIEPNVGFAVSGGWEQGNQDDDLSMTHIGSRIGYLTAMGLMFGGDLQYGMGTISDTTEADVTTMDLGLFVGYQSFMGLRVYGAYFLSSLIDYDVASNLEMTGAGFKLGVGYQFVEYFALNLEYHMMTYDEAESTSGSGSLINDFETNLIMISASFPIHIF